jgi:hypothetical protein
MADISFQKFTLKTRLSPPAPVVALASEGFAGRVH